jgi:hypothetical protein
MKKLLIDIKSSLKDTYIDETVKTIKSFRSNLYLKDKIDYDKIKNHFNRLYKMNESCDKILVGFNMAEIILNLVDTNCAESIINYSEKLYLKNSKPYIIGYYSGKNVYVNPIYDNDFFEIIFIDKDDNVINEYKITINLNV